MISSSKNRVQEIKSRFENLNSEPAPVRIESHLYKQKHGFTSNLGKENSEININCDISTKKGINVTNDSEFTDECAPQPNNSYLYSKSDIKRSASDAKNSLTRQISDPGKKLHRSHAFRCDKSQKINSTSPKRHGSCNGRSETSDFSFKMERKLSKERLKRLGNLLEEHMKRDNFVPHVEYVELIKPTAELAPTLSTSVSEETVPVVEYVELLRPIENVPCDSIPNSEVPQHILEQYAQIVKPKRNEIEKQDAMTDSGVSSETENVEDEKAGRIQRLRSQFEKSKESSNLPLMDEFCDSSETIRLERKNPHLTLTDTLKKALKQPLPAGPPPKKPPRASNLKPTITEENIEEQKKEAMRKLEKLESLLQQKRETSIEKPEKVNVPKKPKEIHYLCTEILDITNRTLLPNQTNQTSDPISRCLNSLNCAITSNSLSSLPYTRLKSDNRNSLTACFGASNDSLERSFSQSKCMKCMLNEGKDDRFKCHLRCNCVVKNSEFYVDEPIYDVPYSEDDFKVTKKNKYGTINSLKSSKSMEDVSSRYSILVALSFYATGSYQRIVGRSNGTTISQQSVSKAIREVTTALNHRDILTKYIKFPQTAEERTAIKRRFFEKFHIRGVIGCVDGTHVAIVRPTEHEERYFNRKHYHSRNVQIDQKIYDIPYDYRPVTPNIPLISIENQSSKNDYEPLITSEEAPSNTDYATPPPIPENPPKSDFAKLRQNFENGFPEMEIKKTVLVKPKPILVSKLKSDVKFNTDVKKNRGKNEGCITFTLPKREVQLDMDRENLNCLMNELFETVTAVCNMDDNKPGSFPTEHSDSSTSEESVKLTRSLTEKRKNYVRRVSTRVAYLDPKNIKRFRNQTSICSYKSDVLDNPYSTFRSWKSFRTSQGSITKMDTDSKFNLTDSRGNLLSMKDMLDGSKDSIDNLSIDEKTGCVDLPFEPREKGLFNLCLLVGLNYMTGQAYVKSAFPSQAQVPPHIENLVFPETMSTAPKSEWSVDAKSLQCYSLVLTDERGERAYGYCRRVLPEGATTCLPLCYCLIGRYRAPGFYYKVLEEIESLHGRSDFEIHSVLQQLFETDFPNPGEEISVLYTNTTDYTKEIDGDNGRKSKTLPERRLEKTAYADLENNNAVKNIMCNMPRIKLIKRPIEPRVDEDNVSAILDVLGAGLLIKVFASLLLERKVIIIGHHMRLVSSCVEALQSALYPFVWQQPLISSIPREIQREVLEAPLPMLAGMLHTPNCDLSDVAFEEGMLIDLTQTSKVLFYQGDESTILPTSSYKSLKTSLQMETAKHKDASDNKTRNVMISEAFLRFFVEILGDFWQYFSVREMKDGDLGKGDVVFDKESFVKNAPSKQNQYFLDWFTETAMFTHFIQNMAASYHHRENENLPPPTLVDTPLPNFYELFNERVKTRHNKNVSNKNIDNSKNNYKNAVNKKVKFLKSKLRDLVA